MKKFLSAIAVLALTATSALAGTAQLADDYVTRVGVQSATDNSTYVPALEVRVDGVTYVHRVGEDGLTRNIVFYEERAEAWASSLYGKTIRVVQAGGGGGGFVDSNGNGVMDTGEEGAGGGGF